MSVLARRLLAALLVLAGVALAGFFWLLFAIADCSVDCQRAGERAVPLALVGAGLGLVVAGALLCRGGGRRALAWGLVAAGALAAAAIAWIMLTEGSRGQATWLLLASVVVAGLGAGLVRGR